MEKKLYGKIGNEEFGLLYYLIKTNNNFRDGVENDGIDNSNIPGYGVEVEEINNAKISKSQNIVDISVEEEKVHKFLNLLLSNRVSPFILEKEELRDVMLKYAF